MDSEPSKLHRPWWKRWWVWLIGVLVIISLPSAIVQSLTGQNTAEETTPTVSQPTFTVPEMASPPVSYAPITPAPQVEPSPAATGQFGNCIVDIHPDHLEVIEGGGPGSYWADGITARDAVALKEDGANYFVAVRLAGKGIKPGNDIAVLTMMQPPDEEAREGRPMMLQDVNDVALKYSRLPIQSESDPNNPLAAQVKRCLPAK